MAEVRRRHVFSQWGSKFMVGGLENYADQTIMSRLSLSVKPKSLGVTRACWVGTFVAMWTWWPLEKAFMTCSKWRALSATQIEDHCEEYLARLTLPFTISLNRLFDYRLDVVQLRAMRQSIWRRWFLQFLIPLFQCQTSPLSKDCHKRQDLEWR